MLFLNLSSKRFYLSIIGVLVLGLLLLSSLLIAKPSKNEPKPLIGILLNDGGQGGYSEYPWYALRQNYSEVIAQSGGIPVFIGHDVEAIEDYLKVLDGVVLSGGDFVTPPQAYTVGLDKDYLPKRHTREHIEFALIKKGYDANLPVLGICAGMQQMNIALGGTVYENLKKSLNTPINHRNEVRHKTHHSVEISPNSKLYHVVKANQLEVNSNHNAGINKVSPKLTVTARAPDGVIESFEAQNKRFFIGVMWHPEYVLSDEEKKLWIAFISAAKEYHLRKS